MKRVCVTGAGGFIGTHLVRRLKQEGYWVRGVDLKKPRWSKSEADEFLIRDLRFASQANESVRGVDWVFHLAADMGGMGFISTAHADIISNNTQINIHTIEAAQRANVERFLFTSSVCVYPVHLQGPDARPLKESDVYPANPQGAYGWEKLHAEHLCEYYESAGWLGTRIVRLHNTYGPLGEWEGGREKAPAALCRKIAAVKMGNSSEVEIWGDGTQVRCYTYIEDCIHGLMAVMLLPEFKGPMTLGCEQEVTIDELADTIADIAGVETKKWTGNAWKYSSILEYVPGPRGVQHRRFDNTFCETILDWKPSIPVEEGLIPTYRWIENEYQSKIRARDNRRTQEHPRSIPRRPGCRRSRSCAP